SEGGLPTITLEGDANGAPHPNPSAYADKFSGRYEHRTITGGVGHNLPQELVPGETTGVREAFPLEAAPVFRSPCTTELQGCGFERQLDGIRVHMRRDLVHERLVGKRVLKTAG